MTVGNSVIKLTAKTTLKKNWINAVITSLIFIFSYFICLFSLGYLTELVGEVITYIIFAAFILFLLAPLFMGLISYFWRMIFGAEDSPIVVFSFFSSKKAYIRALRLLLSLSARIVFWGIILFLPSIIIDIFSGAKIYEILNISTPLWTENLYLISQILKLIAIVILIFVMSKYHLSAFLMIANENIHYAEAIHMSVIISRTTLLDFLGLIFSFLGWFLLSFLVFPLIFVLPYFMTSLCVYTRFAVADHNKKADLSFSNNLPTFSVGL